MRKKISTYMFTYFLIIKVSDVKTVFQIKSKVMPHFFLNLKLQINFEFLKFTNTF